MIEITNTMVEGFEPAIRGMRNSWNSWDKSDSGAASIYGECSGCDVCVYCGGDRNTECFRYLNGYCIEAYFIGEDDLALMKKLVKAGTDHRKFLRMITVWCDITAPRMFFLEFDTYKVGTVSNSCSTMHTILKNPFTHHDFGLDPDLFSVKLIDHLNFIRDRVIELNDVGNTSEANKLWRHLINLLPQSYHQKRTVMLNYEVLMNIYKARKNHKLDEWREFCKWVEKLPYMKELLEVE